MNKPYTWSEISFNCNYMFVLEVCEVDKYGDGEILMKASPYLHMKIESKHKNLKDISHLFETH